MPFHKPIRLEKAIYSSLRQPCSLTIGACHRQPIFTNRDFTLSCVDILKHYTTRHGLKCYAFCFMPDHIHLLAEASKDKSFIDIVRELKGLWTKKSWEFGFRGVIFQKSFFDHFLRKDENIETVARYIFNNPVRAGLAEYWHEYPYLGSMVYTKEQLSGTL